MANKGKKKTKMKTHKGAARRFKITATGKIMHAKGMKSHRRRKKSPRVKRQFDRMLVMSEHTTKRVRKMLPSGLK